MKEREMINLLFYFKEQQFRRRFLISKFPKPKTYFLLSSNDKKQ